MIDTRNERRAHEMMDDMAQWADKHRADMRRVIYMPRRHAHELVPHCTPEPRRQLDGYKTLRNVLLILSSVMVIGGIAGAVLSMIG